jgi:hypothetical protein
MATNPVRQTSPAQCEPRCEAFTERGRCRNKPAPGMLFCRAHIRQFTFEKWYDPVANTRARNELKRWEKNKQAWEKKHPEYFYPEPLPASTRRLVCGATTRRGTPCRRRDLYRSGRCPLHGGLSTGPRTAAGKERAAQNGFKKHHKEAPSTITTNPMRTVM